MQHLPHISLLLPMGWASLPPPPPPPLHACDTPQMLPRMIQDIDNVPPYSFSLSLSLQIPLAQTCPDCCLSTSYLSTPIADWVFFVRLSLVSRKVIVLRVVILPHSAPFAPTATTFTIVVCTHWQCSMSLAIAAAARHQQGGASPAVAVAVRHWQSGTSPDMAFAFAARANWQRGTPNATVFAIVACTHWQQGISPAIAGAACHQQGGASHAVWGCSAA